MFRTIVPLLLLLPCNAQETSRAVIKAETRLVLVDAVVTNKKGEFVHGLSEKDFTVLEDSREQVITSFSFEADPASPASSQSRYLMFFFDNATIDLPHQQPIRDAAAQFVAANAGPRRLMSVIEYGPGVQVSQDFTGDGERLKRAISGAKLAHKVEGGFEARRMAWALESVATMLRKVPGRKSLVLVSGGLSQIPNDQMTRLTDAFNKANVAVYPGTDLAGQSTAPARGNSKDLESLSAGANGNGNQQLLRSLMDGTGGSMFYLKDLAGGFERIGKEQNEYYLLGYAPESVEEGKCHHIKVKVTRSGTVARARNLYCPAKPADLLSGTPVEKDLENVLASSSAGSLKAVAQVPYFYSDSGTVRMSVAFDFPTGAVTLEKRKGGRFHGQVNLLGIIYRADGGPAARFSDTVNLDFDDKATMDAWKQKPSMYYEKDVEGLAGSYTLKLIISAGADRFAKLELPIQIAAYDGQKLALSGIAFSTSVRTLGKKGEVRDLESEDNTPLIANGMQFFPSARTTFKKGEHVALYAELYAPAWKAANFAASVRLRLFDNTGQVKLDSGQMRQDPLRPGETVAPMALTIPVDKLEAGEYLCELVGSDTTGGRVRRLASFTVE
jgi:VWFA-related protein